MSTIVKVIRYHLLEPVQTVFIPIAVVGFTFLVNLVIFTAITAPAEGGYTGGLFSLNAFVMSIGIISVTRALPFGFALGLSRRTYYLGTMALAAALSAAYALSITARQAVERATGGWGINLHFFRVAWILDGPWYVTWLTSFVLLVATFLYGIWYGLVSRRWGVPGLVTFIACQVIVLLAASLLVTWLGAWGNVGTFFTTLSVLGLTGVVAAIAAALALGGFATMRRVTV